MDPRALARPVGPLPARVYWTRRLLLLALLVVVVAAVAASCSGGSPSPHRTGAGATTRPTSTPSPAAPAAPPACTRVQLSVTAAADATTYAAGVLPHLSVTIRNRSARTCRFADSAVTRTWSIVSGTDQVWTDAGCPGSKATTARTLRAGRSVRHTLVWDRHRSGAGCATTSTSADPGTYRVYVTVDGQRSAAAVFHLTG